MILYDTVWCDTSMILILYDNTQGGWASMTNTLLGVCEGGGEGGREGAGLSHPSNTN